MDDKKPNIIALTEIMPKTKTEVSLSEIDIPGYTTFINKSPKRGIAIFTKYNLNAKENDNLANSDFQESVWCDFKDANND